MLHGCLGMIGNENVSPTHIAIQIRVGDADKIETIVAQLVEFCPKLQQEKKLLPNMASGCFYNNSWLQMWFEWCAA